MNHAADVVECSGNIDYSICIRQCLANSVKLSNKLLAINNHEGIWILTILDFKEIPPANSSDGKQDTFEIFARDFFSMLGYTIVSNPNRGADGGKDIIIREIRTGLGGETIINWLVSCKHNAHSGKSVTPTDEANIRDRVESNECSGFIGFYSTLKSSGLSNILENLKKQKTLEVQEFDSGKIEDHLLSSNKGLFLCERFFPESIKKWKKENKEPVKIFTEDPSIRCDYCDKELLESKHAILVALRNYEKQEKDESYKRYYEKIYCCCKGNCDEKLLNKYSKKEYIDSWKDFEDLKNPTEFIRYLMSIINNLQKGDVCYTDEAFESLKEILLNIYPFVSRELTPKEEQKINQLVDLPKIFGGYA